MIKDCFAVFEKCMPPAGQGVRHSRSARSPNAALAQLLASKAKELVVISARAWHPGERRVNEPARTDADFMNLALRLAARAEAEGEVPVGAVVVRDGEVIGQGWNRNIALNDPSAHAEIVALRDAGRRVSNHRLVGATLYVTLEPCVMCVGACLHARLERVVFGAPDPKTGAMGGQIHLQTALHHNHVLEVQSGVLAEDSARMLKRFFQARRRGASHREKQTSLS